MSMTGSAAVFAEDQTGTGLSFKARATAVIGAGVGNVLEWYDFTVYAYLAGILGRRFFDSSNETAAILATFAVFGVGFAARPLGGILIGMIGDRYGRKPTLLLTFLLIAVSTGLIGVLPTYATIGLAAPILLVFARLLQGVSAGGEWGGAASFLVEWAPPKRRGFFGSMHPCAITLGQLLGAGVTGALATTLGADEMSDWGWRVPFLLGAVIGPIGLLVRSRVNETPAFRRAKVVESTAPVQSFSMLSTMGLAFAFPVLQSVLTYLFLSYFPTFSQRYIHLSVSASLWSTALATIVMGSTSLLSGYLSDRVGRRTCLLAACALSVVLSYPLLMVALDGASLGMVVLIQACFAAICGLFLGPMPAALVEMFPTARRMTGLTTAYNMQSMLFGGFAPFIAVWLIAGTGKPISIAFFIMLAAVLSAAAVLCLRETAHDELI